MNTQNNICEFAMPQKDQILDKNIAIFILNFAPCECIWGIMI